MVKSLQTRKGSWIDMLKNGHFFFHGNLQQRVYMFYLNTIYVAQNIIFRDRAFAV